MCCSQRKRLVTTDVQYRTEVFDLHKGWHKGFITIKFRPHFIPLVYSELGFQKHRVWLGWNENQSPQWLFPNNNGHLSCRSLQGQCFITELTTHARLQVKSCLDFLDKMTGYQVIYKMTFVIFKREKKEGLIGARHFIAAINLSDNMNPLVLWMHYDIKYKKFIKKEINLLWGGHKNFTSCQVASYNHVDYLSRKAGLKVRYSLLEIQIIATISTNSWLL